MFGLNDNDKKDDSAETVAPNAPTPPPSSDIGTDSAISQPPFPPPLPTIPPASTPPAAVDAPTEAPATGLEAVPSPVAAPVDTAPMNAEDTMPELTALDSVNMSDNFIDEGPKVSKRKKSAHKNDDSPAHADAAGGTPHEEELLKLKQQALQSLAPLVDKLDQSPEEKFKTTMMLIQASDNAELVQEAYAAANAIEDEKARAQALLDVVNEINYFTQHSDAAHHEGA